jgi:hypothetical protein
MVVGKSVFLSAGLQVNMCLQTLPGWQCMHQPVEWFSGCAHGLIFFYGLSGAKQVVSTV